jgi:hypothetical protein
LVNFEADIDTPVLHGGQGGRHAPATPFWRPSARAPPVRPIDYGPTHTFGTESRSKRCGDATAEDG